MTTAADQNVEAHSDESLAPQQLLEMLRSMMIIRRFEERCAQSYQQAKIGGFCHLYIGQEACAVGTVSAMRSDDPVVGAYRDHGLALARGMHPNMCMAEMFGRLEGCAKGKGGSMHMFDLPNHMYGGHAIVGGQCPLGVGLAFATKYKGEEKVTLCYLGDGALNQGAFHESMNLAAIWNLPVIFVLENNAYSMGTSIQRGTSNADNLKSKADAYGMRYAECDGLDAIDTCLTTRREAERTREGGGPCFMNVITYRYFGHSMSDPQKYRTKDEVAEKQEQDPIKRLSNYMIERSLADLEQIDELDKESKQMAKDAVKYAENGTATPMDELYTDVYLEPFGPYKRGDLPPEIKKVMEQKGEAE